MQEFMKHDQELFNKISIIFTLDLQMQLKDFDYGNIGNANILSPLFEMNHYKGSIDFTFINIDQDFSKNYADLQAYITEFINKFSTYTTPYGNGRFHVAPEAEWDIGDYDRYRGEADEINLAARQLYNILKSFIISGKKRMRMRDEKAVQNEVHYHAPIHGNASVGNGNTIINSHNAEYDQKVKALIQEIRESTLHDRAEILHQIDVTHQTGNKEGTLKILGGLLSRGNEAASFIASIGSVLAL